MIPRNFFEETGSLDRDEFEHVWSWTCCASNVSASVYCSIVQKCMKVMLRHLKIHCSSGGIPD